MHEGMRDALIIGAGPVGLTMALACRRNGVSFRLIDRLSTPSGLSKALAVWSAALEMLDGLGIADEFEARAIRGQGMRLSTGGRLLAQIPAATGIDSPRAEMLLLPQATTEEILAARLGESGGGLERGMELTAISSQPDRVTAEIRTADGARSREDFRWAVACDGAHSTVRHLIGAEFEGEAVDQAFVLCDARISGEIAAGYAHMFWARDGMLAAFPVVPGLWRIIAAREDGAGDKEPDLAEMQEVLDRRGPGGWTLSQPTWFSKFRISERKATQFRHGRIFLVGDAAHVHSPTGGQGMNTGMQDAANLAWKFGILAAGAAAEDKILQSYHEERSPVAGHVLAESGRLLRAGFLRNPALQFLRNTAVRVAGRSKKFQARMMLSLSGLDISYAPGPLVGGDRDWHEDWQPHGFRPGTRPRDARVLRGSEPVSLFREWCTAPYFTLLLFSGRKPIYRDVDRLAAVALVASGFGRMVKSVRVWHGTNPPAGDWLLDPDASAHRKFGVDSPSFYLIRGDGYVAIRSQPAEAVVLHRWLECVIGGGQADALPA